jgi:hypothetical protein
LAAGCKTVCATASDLEIRLITIRPTIKIIIRDMVLFMGCGPPFVKKWNTNVYNNPILFGYAIA